MEPTSTSLNALITQLVSQIERLLMAHLRLAREEITADSRRFAIRAGGLLVAGILGVLGLLFLGVAAIAGLTFLVDLWLAALLVSLLFFIVCGGLAYQSLQQLKEIDPTNLTREETKETIAWLRQKN